MVPSVSLETEHAPAKVMTVSRESPAIPVDGGRAWPRCRWAVAGPGRASRRRAVPINTPGTTGVEGAGGICRGAGGRWRGLAGLRGDAPSEARGADGERAGRRPPEHTAAGPDGTRNTREATSSPAHTTARVHHTTTQVRQRGGYRSTRPLSAHSATASSRLRPNDPQSWRRRRIHRNMPPTTAAPRPAPPIRPSKPVRARPFFGLVAGTSGAT